MLTIYICNKLSKLEPNNIRSSVWISGSECFSHTMIYHILAFIKHINPNCHQPCLRAICVPSIILFTSQIYSCVLDKTRCYCIQLSVIPSYMILIICISSMWRKLADKVAAAGFFVVVPDFFHGDPVIDWFDPKFDRDTWMKVHNTVSFLLLSCDLQDGIWKIVQGSRK